MFLKAFYLNLYLKNKNSIMKNTKHLSQFTFYCTLHFNFFKFMKPFFSLICILFLVSCNGNSVDDKNCRFLLDIGVNFTIDLSLPQYSPLTFAGNSVYIPNEGNAGIIVASTGVDFYAWDASDPNHAPSSCSALIPSGLNGTCGCDDGNKYNFVTGTIEGNDGLRCALKNYRVQKTGNTLLIFN